MTEQQEERLASLADEFHERGFVAYPKALAVPDSLLPEAMALFSEVLQRATACARDFGLGAKGGFKEIVRRHDRRFEVRHGVEELLLRTGMQERIGGRIEPVVRAILGSGWRRVSCSLVVSEPGAGDQRWHEDGAHVSRTEHLPCHCLNVFLPLVPVDAGNGATELRPASQRFTRHPELILVAAAKKQWLPAEQPALEVGDALFFDYRTLHRGRANPSGRPRPVLVLTYSKGWFDDVVNFPPARSCYDGGEGEGEGEGPS